MLLLFYDQQFCPRTEPIEINRSVTESVMSQSIRSSWQRERERGGGGGTCMCETDGGGGGGGVTQRVSAANGALMNEKIDLVRRRVASKQVCTHSRR